jgi:plastocyanin
MNRRPLTTLLAVAGLLAAVALPACGGGSDSDKGKEEGKAPPAGGPLSGEAPVRIVNFEFKPQKVVIKPATKVTWTNDDTSIHDIKDTSPLNTPVSQEMSKGETFSITYNAPGTYSYVCGIHPYMTGSVEVVA